MANQPQQARHICRYPECGKVFDPGWSRNNHVEMVWHVRGTHNGSIAKTCGADCGYRATPSEGRYTASMRSQA